MTEAGWTHGKDLSAEGQSFMASVKVLIDAIEQEAYQQGRVAAFKEANRKLDNLRDRYLTSNETDLNDFERWLAQAAQDEKEVGDGLHTDSTENC